jgi:hypothetical protein
LAEGFQRYRKAGRTVYVRRDQAGGVLARALLSGFEGLRREFPLQQVRSSRFAGVWRFELAFGGRRRAAYLKRYLPRSAADRVKHLFRAGRAERAFRAALMLEAAGFSTPPVLAAAFGRGYGSNRRQLLVTAGLEGAAPVHRWLEENERDRVRTLRFKRGLIRAFGAEVGRLHAAGIFHGDLRVGNVLALTEGGRWRFFFLDNERTRKFRRLRRYHRVKNLVQANMHRDGVANTDRMRFFNAYLAQSGVDSRKSRALARAVAARTWRRLNKKGVRLLLSCGQPSCAGR